jgi:hypothetical protein
MGRMASHRRFWRLETPWGETCIGLLLLQQQASSSSSERSAAELLLLNTR